MHHRSIIAQNSQLFLQQGVFLTGENGRERGHPSLDDNCQVCAGMDKGERKLASLKGDPTFCLSLQCLKSHHAVARLPNDSGDNGVWPSFGHYPWFVYTIYARYNGLYLYVLYKTYICVCHI